MSDYENCFLLGLCHVDFYVGTGIQIYHDQSI
jgi:hypothetical protein